MSTSPVQTLCEHAAGNRAHHLNAFRCQKSDLKVCSSRKMEDGVKTGTKSKKSGFSNRESPAFTSEILVFMKMERPDPKSTTSGKALIVPVSQIAGHCVSGACTHFDDVVLVLGAVALLGMIGSHVAAIRFWPNG